jgi:hypothetical protein
MKKINAAVSEFPNSLEIQKKKNVTIQNLDMADAIRCLGESCAVRGREARRRCRGQQQEILTACAYNAVTVEGATM